MVPSFTRSDIMGKLSLGFLILLPAFVPKLRYPHTSSEIPQNKLSTGELKAFWIP
jgi:hypothetical protein